MTTPNHNYVSAIPTPPIPDGTAQYTPHEQALKDTADKWKPNANNIRYGYTDCCQFIGSYVEKLTGVNHVKRFAYKNHRQAEGIIEEYDGILGIVTACLGEPRTGEPQAGDVIVFDMGDEQSAGIYNGHFIWSVSVDKGFYRCVLNDYLGVWTIV